jgi:hypothetical protein
VVTVVEFGLFGFGWCLGVWFFKFVLLPVFHGVPKSLVWALRAWVLWRAVVRYFVSPLFWLLMFWVGVRVVTFFFPNGSAYVRESEGFGAGEVLGLLFPVGRLLFSASARAKVQRDFLRFVAFNLTPVGITALEALGVVPTTRAGEA